MDYLIDGMMEEIMRTMAARVGGWAAGDVPDGVRAGLEKFWGDKAASVWGADAVDWAIEDQGGDPLAYTSAAKLALLREAVEMERVNLAVSHSIDLAVDELIKEGE
jgi:hypothetical protein